jgi:hypothetical protein
MKTVNDDFSTQLLRTRTDFTANTVSHDVAWTGPGIRRLVSHGALVRGNRRLPNPWSFQIQNRWSDEIVAAYDQYNSSGTQLLISDLYGGHYVRIPEGLATNHTSDLATVQSEAFTQLIEAIRGKLDVSVDLAQAGKTFKILHDVESCVAATARAITSFKRMPVTAFRGAMKQSGNAWLIWIYGMKPTLQTLHDAVTESTNIMWNDGVTYRGRAQRNAIYSTSETGWPDSAGWSSKTNGNGAYHHLYEVNLVIPKDSIAQAARWSSLNPVSIAWELLPWSFVVDWFLNVGDYLRNLESSMIYSRFFRWGFQTSSWKLEFRRTAERSGLQPGTQNRWSGHYSAYGQDRALNRTLLTSFPSVPTPRWNPNLGPGRLLNAAALLTTFLRR